MYKKVFIILTVYVFLLGMATRAEAENAVKEEKTANTAESNIESEGSEKYISKVIIKAKWGDGPGEFGRVPYPKSVPPVGPSDFYVSSDGSIYVLDDINNRIQVFEKDGGLKNIMRYNSEEISDSISGFMKIAVDKENNVYLLGVLEYPSKDGLIVVFDKEGTLISKILLPVNFFLEEFPDGVKNPYVGQIITGLEMDISSGFVYLKSIGLEISSYMVGSTESFKKDSKSGGLFYVPSNVSRKVIFRSDSRVSDVCRVKNASLIHLLGKNSKNDVFATVDFKKIYIIGSDFRGVDSIEVPDFDMEYDSERTFFISDSGDVYYWANDESGLRIYKYSRN